MTVRIGCFGVGLIGREHIRRISETLSGGVVTAIADPHPDFARSVAPQFAGVGVSEDATSLAARDDVDAVLVTADDDNHESGVLAALAAGKPVFCEKPLTPTPEGCLRIMEAESATGRRLVQVGFMRRFDPDYGAVKQAIVEGVVGAPLLTHMAHRNVRPESMEWQSWQAITQTAVHEFDLTRWLLEEEIVSVRVDRGRSSSEVPEGASDPLVTVLETESGVRVDVETFIFCQYGYDIRCEVVGEHGTVALPDPPKPQLRLESGAGHAIGKSWRDRFTAAYNREIQAWIHAAAAGGQTGPTSWDGYAAQALCAAALKSLAEPGTLVRPELIAKPTLYRVPAEQA
jgi:myo-inositol 2-dehydrogenase/D-chiro-inositol 1-dehydrogenase